MLLTLGVPIAGHSEEPVVSYWPNPLKTTPFGPAKADILLRPANFVPCRGGPIALCYYSGPEPEPGEPDLFCEVTDDGQFANCRCVEIPSGPYYVDINAIHDVRMYWMTVKKCGKDGVDCRGKPNKAPVCRAINEGRLFARKGAQRISTFSLALGSSQGFAIGGPSCGKALYAGCMTAPCKQTGEKVRICHDTGSACSWYPIDICACPTFDGPYQVGKAGGACDDTGEGQPGSTVWSAAYNPLKGDTFPSPGCFPDVPGDKGCPLLATLPDSDPPEPAIPSVPNNISCRKVCNEYRGNMQNGLQVGFTCDATLCTATGKDHDLVSDACTGIQNGEIGETLLLETQVGCSCCASQICGCESNAQTNAEIRMLNQEQRDRDITPQCDINGTLCGTKSRSHVPGWWRH